MSDPFAEDIIAVLPNLKRFAISLCRRPDLADDLVQTAVERALRGRTSYDPTTRLEPWLFRILRNAWIDITRRNQTRGVEVDADTAFDMPTVDGVRDIEARLMLDKTNTALQTLPDEQREVMILVCMQEMTYKEASAILDIPIGTVMSRLARGRLALAEKLGIS
ncbi:RNA polymerase sigma factor [uncultured Aliiroseovarius sp.]|uniref:RNA polymerase sigma factor n=1 Tax=uncultured Aliiroseovarius sp. TaxID=1658783 RepID=UPI0025955C66|nr:RNA polymerase sigma factor [uncultured Aliiroseovarius sp.]